ncbi:hypothetical protein B0H14DRAFT_3449613 [Mycena olivaceomarginata]|nr:hypothetical protein B0H14DRAFT_3449613 [Mycena olivaceomarginata]
MERVVFPPVEPHRRYSLPEKEMDIDIDIDIEGEDVPRIHASSSSALPQPQLVSPSLFAASSTYPAASTSILPAVSTSHAARSTSSSCFIQGMGRERGFWMLRGVH